MGFDTQSPSPISVPTLVLPTLTSHHLLFYKGYEVSFVLLNAFVYRPTLWSLVNPPSAISLKKTDFPSLSSSQLPTVSSASRAGTSCSPPYPRLRFWLVASQVLYILSQALWIYVQLSYCVRKTQFFVFLHHLWVSQYFYTLFYKDPWACGGQCEILVSPLGLSTPQFLSLCKLTSCGSLC